MCDILERGWKQTYSRTNFVKNHESTKLNLKIMAINNGT